MGNFSPAENESSSNVSLNATKAAMQQINWLNNKVRLSNGHQRKIRYDIRRKLRTFYEFELPLLVKSGLASVIANCNMVTGNCNINYSQIVQNNEICAQNKSLGRDLDPGPLPYQGNALPG